MMIDDPFSLFISLSHRTARDSCPTARFCDTMVLDFFSIGVYYGDTWVDPRVSSELCKLGNSSPSLWLDAAPLFANVVLSLLYYVNIFIRSTPSTIS
jgi:hypothetical protein